MANQITVFLDPTKMPNQSQAQATFDNNLAAIFATFPIFGQQLNAAIAAFNVAAAGSAYAIPYTVDLSSTTDADPGNGTLRFDNATQSAATTLRLDLLNNLGGSVAAILDTFDASTNPVKGTIRLVKMGDATAYLMFNVTARTAPTGYRDISVTPGPSSANNPFAQGDVVLLHFTRTGDKGDTGTTTAYPIMIVRDQTGSGLAAQSMTSGAWNQRRLNTVSFNQISGASVASNQITLPSGSYWIDARAAGFASAGHNLRLYNVTDGLAYDYGISEYSVPTSGSATSTTAELRTYISLTTSKTFRLDHYVVGPGSGNGTGGTPVSNGAAEVYAEIKITKVA